MRINDRWNLPRPVHRKEIPKHIPTEEFLELFVNGYIVDGRAGGFILGRPVAEGKSRVIYRLGSDYVIGDFVGGGDFLVNAEGSAKHMSWLKALNAGRRDPADESDPDASEVGMLLAITAYPHDRLVLIDFNQIIVRKEAAMRCSAKLGQVNFEDNPYYWCDHARLFNLLDQGTDDGIV